MPGYITDGMYVRILILYLIFDRGILHRRYFRIFSDSLDFSLIVNLLSRCGGLIVFDFSYFVLDLVLELVFELELVSEHS